MLRKMLLASACIACLAAPSVANAGTFGNDYHVTVVNDTGAVLQEVYASNRDTGDWLDDLLGSSVLVPGDSATLDMDDGSGYCMYDLKAVFDDGAIVRRMNANVCEAYEWTIYD